MQGSEERDHTSGARQGQIEAATALSTCISISLINASLLSRDYHVTIVNDFISNPGTFFLGLLWRPGDAMGKGADCHIPAS